ncbi:MAG: LPS-assembly protein LptD [Pseudomonadota bacterium]
MRLLRSLTLLAAGLALGLAQSRLPAAEAAVTQVANPYETLPRCPDDAAASRQQKISKPLDPNEQYEVNLGTLHLDSERNAQAGQKVTVQQGEHTLSADRASISQDQNRIDVEGTVEYRDPQLVIRGNTGSFDGQLATFEGAQFELPTRPARGAATSLSVDQEGVVRLKDVEYTTCPVGKSDWMIKADSVAIDTAASVGTAHDARVEFFGVPLVRLPLITFPVGNARKTGLLFPTFGTSTRGGVQMSVPWYWNIAPQQDLTVTPTWYTARGIDMEGDYRYLTHIGKGELSANFLPDDRKANETRSRWRLNTVTGLPDDWRLTIAGENVSDAQYFEDFSHGASDGSSTTFLPRYTDLAWRDANFHAGIMARNFQTLDQDLPKDERPATELPRIYAHGDWRLDGTLPLNYGLDTEATYFRHPGEEQGWRFDAEPRVGLDYSGPGYFVRPSAMLDAAGYRLHDNPAGTDDTPTRTLPVLSLDTGLTFEGNSGSHDQRRVTLEPRAMYLYAPYRNQSDLPLFDSSEPDLNWIELFRTNRYVGLDRISDANQLSFGLTTQMYSSSSGMRILSTTIGQTINFVSPKVRLPGEVPDSGEFSDVIAQVELSAYHNWNISTGMQWNPYDNRTERAEVRLQYQPAPTSVLNLGYRYQYDRLEQVEASVAWPLTDEWHVYGRMLYSLRENQPIEQLAGFEYNSCCWAVRAVVRDYVSRRTGARDRSVYLQLELKGLSNVGQAADAFLEKAIRGYSARQRP